MNRLYILLTVMVVMGEALFAGQEALAKVLDGTAGEAYARRDRHGRPPPGRPRGRLPQGQQRQRSPLGQPRQRQDHSRRR